MWLNIYHYKRAVHILTAIDKHNHMHKLLYTYTQITLANRTLKTTLTGGTNFPFSEQVKVALRWQNVTKGWGTLSIISHPVLLLGSAVLSAKVPVMNHKYLGIIY